MLFGRRSLTMKQTEEKSQRKSGIRGTRRRRRFSDTLDLASDFSFLKCLVF